MIAYVKGIVHEKTEGGVIVENNDLGFEVAVSVPLWRKLKTGDVVQLFTHEYIREDSRELYGFATPGELRFFRKLISISGVGPKIALHVLSLGTLRDIEAAVTTGNVAYLTAIPGIGAKTAQKIVIELKGRLDLAESPGGNETLEALQSLGYTQMQAREALRRISPDVTDVGERVRAALKVLGQRVR
ncbi:Holliday junction branch migration protein RuvA [Candidatus Uhrbacteria bacterium]|nr:Holliday junction branch migration protein RuvA [Candidatus Uhrbacteria bacterium]